MQVDADAGLWEICIITKNFLDEITCRCGSRNGLR